MEYKSKLHAGRDLWTCIDRINEVLKDAAHVGVVVQYVDHEGAWRDMRSLDARVLTDVKREEW